ncbi:LysR family transcriptional regulator [Bacteriovoracaceae bacterium]|nr:LysR family transcriptional regulator [Bacteriovoracaceae bacterium]
MERLNFSHLFYFYVVAKEGSIKSAAEKLFVSQPTISDQIKLLEQYLQCKLFERQHRQLSLTKEGELALDYGERIFSMSKELTSRLRHNIKIPKTSFDIGMTPYMSQYFLYDFVMPLFEQKDYTINMHQEPRHILLAELEEENIDMIFTDEKDSLPAWTDYRRIGINRTFVVGHKKFRKYKKNFPESLNEIPFFSYSNDSTLKHDIEMYFSQNAITPRVIGQAEDIDLYQLVTEQGLAFTIVPEVAKNRLCLNKDVIVLGELKEFQTSIWAVLKKGDRGLGYKLMKGKL